MTLTDPGLVISFLAKKTSSQQHDDYYTAYTLPFTRRFLAWFSAGQHAYITINPQKHCNQLTRKFKRSIRKGKITSLPSPHFAHQGT